MYIEINEENLLKAIKQGRTSLGELLTHFDNVDGRNKLILVARNLRDKGLIAKDPDSYTKVLSIPQPKTSKHGSKRFEALMPDGVPRYIRCYDDEREADRYTVVYSGRCGGYYVGMSPDPYHPQGAGQHGDGLIDRNHNCWPPTYGRKCQLGTRVHFFALPDKCQQLVLSEYAEAWKLDLDDVKHVFQQRANKYLDQQRGIK